MKKQFGNSIECIINDGLAIRLENVVEVYGHDDSLPFNADVFVYDKEDESGCYHKIAIAYNDGWGGNSVIEPTQLKYQQQLNKFDTFLRANYEFVYGSFKTDVTMEGLISSLAWLGVNSKNPMRFSITKLPDCKEKTK